MATKRLALFHLIIDSPTSRGRGCGVIDSRVVPRQNATTGSQCRKYDVRTLDLLVANSISLHSVRRPPERMMSVEPVIRLAAAAAAAATHRAFR